MHYIFAYTECNHAAAHALQGYFLVAVIGAITLLQISIGQYHFFTSIILFGIPPSKRTQRNCKGKD